MIDGVVWLIIHTVKNVPTSATASLSAVKCNHIYLSMNFRFVWELYLDILSWYCEGQGESNILQHSPFGLSWSYPVAILFLFFPLHEVPFFQQINSISFISWNIDRWSYNGAIQLSTIPKRKKTFKKHWKVNADSIFPPLYHVQWHSSS